MNKKSRFAEYSIPIAITLILLLASFLLHYYCESTMAQDEAVWEYRLKVHTDGYPFSIRHFTSGSIIFLHNHVGLSIHNSFFVLQFFLAFWLGPAFYRYLSRLNFSKTAANIGVALLMTAYPIMSAHFEPVFTWDDFWNYLFSIISFMLILDKRFVWSGIFFAIGCFAREQTIFLYPAYVFSILFFTRNENWKKRAAYILFPIIIWTAYYLNVMKRGDPNRLKYLTFNFESFVWARDSVFSMFVSFGFIWLASFIAWFRLIEKKRGEIASFLFWGYFLTLPVNTIFTLTMTFARETRIFFPPFIFAIPLALILVIASIQYWRELSNAILKAGSIILLMVALFAGYILVVSIIFPEFRYRQCWNYSQIWAGVSLALSLVLFGLYLLSKKYRAIYEAIESNL